MRGAGLESVLLIDGKLWPLQLVHYWKIQVNLFQVHFVSSCTLRKLKVPKLSHACCSDAQRILKAAVSITLLRLSSSEHLTVCLNFKER